jgi:hypothetical protein
MVLDNFKHRSRRSGAALESRQTSTSAVKGGMISALAIALT